MAPKRRLSAVLLETGRITEEEVERALEHQRTHGGYFGEALVALGLIERQAVDWALAKQLDLPFIFPDADAADRRATALVGPDWALAHLAVPILHAGDAITVVVADPLEQDTLEDLRARTGLKVEMALASESRIRQLIRAVYGAPDPLGAAEAPPVRIADLMAEALTQAADRIGVSVRGATARGWYCAGDLTRRRLLVDGWEGALEDMLARSPVAAARDAEGAIAVWEDVLTVGGADLAVTVQATTGPTGSEFLVRPRPGAQPPTPPGVLPGTIRADLRLLAGTGGARVGLADRAADLLARLPALVLGGAARTAHVAVREPVPGVFTLRVEAGGDVAAALEGYAFDAVTSDLPLEDDRLPAILAAAPITFVRVPERAAPAALQRAGINWILTATGDQDALAWELRPMSR